MASFRLIASLTAIAAVTLSNVNAVLIPMTYCATLNTASMAANYSIYQSDGLCRDFCTANNNAYAVIKDSNCWCSDYTPAQGIQVGTDKCSKPCPGFPDDTCGGDGTWGYIQLQAKPSGVKGDNGGSQTTSDPVSSNTNTATTPVVIISTVTNPGGTSQVTITLPPSSNGGSAAQNDVSTTGSGITTGAAVGIAVGVLALVGIIAGLGAWFCIRRRNQNKEEAAVERSNSGRGSSAGMMSTPRTEMASIWDSEQLSTGRRNSRLMPHDPRMDPFAGNIYGQANKSRESVNTLQDNQDYSRKVLRTTNPDPDQD